MVQNHRCSDGVRSRWGFVILLRTPANWCKVKSVKSSHHLCSISLFSGDGLRVVAIARPPPLSPPSTLSSALRSPSFPKPTSTRPQFRPIPLTTPTILSLFALFLAPNYAKAFSFSKDQIISLTQVENIIDQAEEVGSSVLGLRQCVLEVVIDTLKPGVDLALPLLHKFGDHTLKIDTPAFSEVSRKAQEAL